MTEKKGHLLIVEDEASLREITAERLSEHGYLVTQADTGETACSLLADFAFDIVITDLRLPGMDGMAVIEKARELYSEIITVVVTGYGTVPDAVTAIKRGASDFVTKPFQFDHLLHILASTLEQRRLKSENAYLRSQLQQGYGFQDIIGQSPAMLKLFKVLETVSNTTSTILLTGETGTGKELVARAIHHNSSRAQERFVPLNCGAIPETLLETELFGHVKGAFTGAIANRPGRLEQADRGTLFLDEIGTMSANLQSKLLRVLQEREFERVGDAQSTKVDVRFIAATNSDLAEMIKLGRFREDLFYRLNVIPIHLPPLRDRREDVPLLVQRFINKLGQKQEPARANIRISQEAMRRMMAFDWPGNIRQLENTIERILVLTPGQSQIDISDLPLELQETNRVTTSSGVSLPESGIDLQNYLRNLERSLLGLALERTGGNQNKAAELLNIKRTTFIEKTKRLSLDS
ncbi:MAG TPA: sigma-54-dependent Fis family transcriptional regulator [Acidobacteria bacterium]|nr:sigma-54-dependent Fis family transcriptional regulator [Acidobacteriota bacterium]